jgi:hypothetical protein
MVRGGWRRRCQDLRTDETTNAGGHGTHALSPGEAAAPVALLGH